MLSRSFVIAQNSLRFCPGPSCDQALHLSPSAESGSMFPLRLSTSSFKPSSSSISPLQTTSPTITCTNAHTICFLCAYPGGHDPIPCSLARFWLDSIEDDRRRREANAVLWKKEQEEVRENELWKAMNSKYCPKCGVPIEKSTGCKCVHLLSFISLPIF